MLVANDEQFDIDGRVGEGADGYHNAVYCVWCIATFNRCFN